MRTNSRILGGRRVLSDEHRSASRRSRALATCSAVFAVLTIASCGSKTSEMPNASSAGDAGSAGASTPGLCAVGDTRSCVGPGACSGGQACGNDGKWSACDCGAPSGGQGSGGGSSAAGSAGVTSGGASGQGASGAGGAVAGGGGSGDAAGAGGLNAGDEPCPSGPINADCSGQCAAKAAVCDAVCPTAVTVTSVSFGQVLARTPSGPGTRCRCSDGRGPTAYWLNVLLDPEPTGSWHVSVPGPWHATHDGIPLACVFPLTASCASFEFGGAPVLPRVLKGVEIWTADPTAPAVNIVAEPGDCP